MCLNRDRVDEVYYWSLPDELVLVVAEDDVPGERDIWICFSLEEPGRALWQTSYQLDTLLSRVA